MPLEGLREKRQTQARALPPLHPAATAAAAATTERHGPPQATTAASPRPVPPLQPPAQSQPFTGHACTTQRGLEPAGRSPPPPAWTSGSLPTLAGAPLPASTSLPRHNHTEHELRALSRPHSLPRRTPGQAAFSGSQPPAEESPLSPRSPSLVPPTPTSPQFATHFAAMAKGCWKPYCCWAVGAEAAAAAAAAMGEEAQRAGAGAAHWAAAAAAASCP